MTINERKMKTHSEEKEEDIDDFFVLNSNTFHVSKCNFIYFNFFLSLELCAMEKFCLWVHYKLLAVDFIEKNSVFVTFSVHWFTLCDILVSSKKNQSNRKWKSTDLTKRRINNKYKYGEWSFSPSGKFFFFICSIQMEFRSVIVSVFGCQMPGICTAIRNTSRKWVAFMHVGHFINTISLAQLNYLNYSELMKTSWWTFTYYHSIQKW